MRDVAISDELRAKAPATRLGVLSARVVATEHDAGLWSEIDARVAVLEAMLASAEIATIPEIAATRRAYKALGKDPSRYRPSAEALLRRIGQGKGLYRVSTIVDANNLVSLETYHSIGLYDVRFVAGPVVFRPGRAGESYEGIAKGEINLEGLPVFADDEGPFGNPSSDSARTRVREDTAEVLMAIVAFAGAAGLDTALARAAELLGRYAGATNVETRVV
jgi:DNA/RNA-binding domain of Phe-tRNA-synthetase-like protein